VQISARVLGVTPTSPGFKMLAVRPTLCDLTWAKGTVPTPRGNVAVSWALGDDRLSLDASVPQDAEAEVAAPVARFENVAIRLDGHRVGPVARVSAGARHFEVTGKLKKPAAVKPADDQPSAADCDGFEQNVVKGDLRAISPILAMGYIAPVRTRVFGRP
jgi:hypothetical protein